MIINTKQHCILIFVTKTNISGCTVPPDSKETKLGSSD